MFKRLSSLLLPLAFLALPSVVSAAANVYPSGPQTVNVGQTFQVVMTANGAKDVDTVRLNGSYTQDLLQWKGASPTGVFQNVSPGTYVDEKSGIFSFGAFSLSSHANDTARLAVLTFKALKEGTSYVQLTTNSRILSAGEDQMGTVGRLTIKIVGAKPVPEQPQPLPPVVPSGKAAISLISSTAPDPNAWYASDTVAVNWQVTGKTVKTTYVGFDQSPEGPAETRISGSSASFPVPSDGVWYVHLNVVFTDGTSQRADLRVQIDLQTPHTVSPTTDQTQVPASIANAARFGTTDDTSGVDHYDLFIDGALVTSTGITSYPLLNLAPGTHDIRVNVYDRAGNHVTGQTQFVITAPFAAQSATALPGFSTKLLWGIFLILFLLFILFSWFIFGRQKRKRQRK